MMTIAALKQSGCILYECISGSRAYGLDTPTSDTDIKGVFVLPKHLYYGFDYIGQVNNETNDVVYYELKKFLELCMKNNPNILEMLYTPEDCILYKHPLFDSILQESFLSKQCALSFSNYAYTQIKKAAGLEKKISNPMERERKTVLDFCYVYEGGNVYDLKKFLNENHRAQEHCALTNVQHIKNSFNLYYHAHLSYKGIVSSEDANEVCLSNVPKEEKPIAMLYFNKEGYSTYCKQYRAYWDWVAMRNEDRYTNNIAHGKNYDSKNLMHTFRLLLMAKEIATDKTLNVRRPDREFLLDIKNGKFEYGQLMNMADDLKAEVETLFEVSDLPEVTDVKNIYKLVIDVREKFYSIIEI